LFGEVKGTFYMTSVPTVLDYVAEILKSAPRPLLAKEICDQLAQTGLIIERAKLTQILWNQNDRMELIVDNKHLSGAMIPKPL
jgi:hypothetical protein